MRSTDSIHFPLLYLSFFEFLSSFGLEEEEGRRDELIISAKRNQFGHPNKYGQKVFSILPRPLLNFVTKIVLIVLYFKTGGTKLCEWNWNASRNVFPGSSSNFPHYHIAEPIRLFGAWGFQTQKLGAYEIICSLLNFVPGSIWIHMLPTSQLYDNVKMLTLPAGFRVWYPLGSSYAPSGLPALGGIWTPKGVSNPESRG